MDRGSLRLFEYSFQACFFSEFQELEMNIAWLGADAPLLPGWALLLSSGCASRTRSQLRMGPQCTVALLQVKAYAALLPEDARLTCCAGFPLPLKSLASRRRPLQRGHVFTIPLLPELYRKCLAPGHVRCCPPLALWFTLLRHNECAIDMLSMSQLICPLACKDASVLSLWHTCVQCCRYAKLMEGMASAFEHLRPHTHYSTVKGKLSY